MKHLTHTHFGKALLATAFLAPLFLLSGSAEARRGVVVYQSGEQIFDAGELPESLTPDEPGWRAGYKCQVFGLFWALFHTWDCKAVAYKGDAFNDSPEVVEAIGAAYTPDDRTIDGFWAANGRWFFGGALAIVLVLLILGLVVGGNEDEDEDEDEAAEAMVV